MKITAEDCVRVLKDVGNGQTAEYVAGRLKSTSRAVATALRKPTSDGRIGVMFYRGKAHYTFLRLNPKDYTLSLQKIVTLGDKALRTWIWRNGYSATAIEFCKLYGSPKHPTIAERSKK